MTQEEIKEILDLHKIWSESYGQKGERADFSNADLHGVDLSGANLRGAFLSRANCKWVDFEGANLREANLEGADLWKANLKNVDLNRADLTRTDLRGVDLRDIDLTKIKNYETTNVWILITNDWKLVPIKEISIRQKMIETNDKNLAILYKNSWMANACKKILKGNT